MTKGKTLILILILAGIVVIVLNLVAKNDQGPNKYSACESGTVLKPLGSDSSMDVSAAGQQVIRLVLEACGQDIVLVAWPSSGWADTTISVPGPIGTGGEILAEPLKGDSVVVFPFSLGKTTNKLFSVTVTVKYFTNGKRESKDVILFYDPKG